MNTLALNTPLNTFLAQIKDYPLLSKEEEKSLAINYYENNDLNSANKLVVSNLRFVVKIASEYKSYGFPLMDLIQEGTIGLMHAVKKFNPYKGYRLISYAVWWIRARIHNHIMKFWSNVKIGTTQAQRKLFQKIGNAKKKLKINNDSASAENVSKIAEHFGVKKKDVLEMEIRMASRDYSLDSNIDDTNATTYKDTIVDSSLNQEDVVLGIQDGAINREALSQSLKLLNKREYQIINDRYLSDDRKTLESIGLELGISKERVRQIEKAAIFKLKKAFTKILD